MKNSSSLNDVSNNRFSNRLMDLSTYYFLMNYVRKEIQPKLLYN